MKFIRRDPSRGYLDSWLWVPKRFINVGGTKNALTWHFADDHTGAVRVLYLYQETDHHLLLPREFWKVSSLPFEVVDVIVEALHGSVALEEFFRGFLADAPDARHVVHRIAHEA